MSSVPRPPVPVLEPAAREPAEATSPRPRIHEVEPRKGRDVLAGLQAGDVPRPDVDEEWVTVDAGEYGGVRTRVVRPKGLDGPPAAVFRVHGRSPIAVCGGPAGGKMSAVFALMANERGDVALRARSPSYPVTGADAGTPSRELFAGGRYLTREGVRWFWDEYRCPRGPARRAEPYASPPRAPRRMPRGLPPSLVITGEADVPPDEGGAYAARPHEAGVDVTAVRVLGMVHDFPMPDSPRDREATVVARTPAVNAPREAPHG